MQGLFDMYAFSFPCAVHTDVAVSVSSVHCRSVTMTTYCSAARTVEKRSMGSMAATLDEDCGCVDDRLLAIRLLTLVATHRAGSVVCRGCWGQSGHICRSERVILARICTVGC